MIDSSRNIGSNQLLDAITMASFAHRHQFRKDGKTPYVSHVYRVMTILRHVFEATDERILIAAVLHDTIEDTDTTADDLRQAFGAEVAAVVEQVTDDKALPKAERKRLQVEHAASISDRAKRVKLADKICNLRDVAQTPPAEWSIERRREYFDWAKLVIDRLRGVDVQLERIFDAAYSARP